MVSELTWTGQLSQGEIALSLSPEEIRVFEKIFKSRKTDCMESCALPEHIFWAWNHSFWMCESLEKSNPSLIAIPENYWTRKLQKLNLASLIWKVKNWNLQNPSSPINSPHSSASLGKASSPFCKNSIFCDFLTKWPQALSLRTS